MSMKRLSALVATAVLALCFGASQAVAAEGDSGAGQAAGQSAASGQSASGGSGAYQLGPSNTASSIRVLSPGDNGDVTQSNSSTAAAIAANANTTDQTVNQSQTGGGSGSSYAQIAGQEAKNAQTADANATAAQLGAKNDALSIRVLSPGDDGDVTQSNSVGAGALAANGNETDQTTDQTQSGGGTGSAATQIAGQAAGNYQDADADATAVQVKPSNTATSIRVLSPGDDGDVTQSNSTTALAAGLNGNATDQSIDQSQGAAPMDAKSAEAERGTAPSYGSDSTQIAGQAADNKQSADADATAVQVKPSNTASSIRVLSPGDGGNVTQSNNATGLAAALNGNTTDQSIDQSQGGGSYEPAKEDGKSTSPSGSSYTQIAGQSADNKQWADADATAVQFKPTNTASSIRVLSPGDDGDVTQSNDATAIGIAANGNETTQSIGQSQGGGSYEPAKEDGKDAKSSYPSGSSYMQIAGQEAGNYQRSDADATAVQVKPTNSVDSIRVLSPGDDGDVTQSNSTTALAAALNLNDTDQSIDQQQSGSGHGSDYLQVAGQGNWSGQQADADSTAIQLGAKNEYNPIRVLSPNGKEEKHGKGEKREDAKPTSGGSVEQSNSVAALGLALNLNKTYQTLNQTQSGRGSSGLQVGGQGSWSSQYGSAGAFGLQGVMRAEK
jgi:hypothetical protein